MDAHIDALLDETMTKEPFIPRKGDNNIDIPIKKAKVPPSNTVEVVVNKAPILNQIPKSSDHKVELVAIQKPMPKPYLSKTEKKPLEPLSDP